MASGNFISSTGVNLNLYIVWSSTINVEGNYSDVLMTAYLRHSTLYVGSRSNQVLRAEGTTSNFDASAISYGSSTIIDTLIGQRTIRVYHNSDGTMPSCDLYGSYYFNGTYGGKSISTIVASRTVALDTIPRKSSISSLTPTVDVNGTNQVTVAISRASASFTHKVTFSIGAYSQEYTGVATSQAFAIPLAWLNSIPNSVSGVANVRVETFSGATSLGYVDGAFTITAPATIIPTVTDIAFARDTTGTDPFTTYAKGISKVSVSGVSVTNQYSATTALIKTYLHLASVSYLTGILFNGSSFISAVIPSAGTMRLTTVVTDSRGRESVAYYEDFTVYDYFAPALTVTAFRCNSAGVADPSGEYLSATMVVNVAPVNNNNTKTYVLEYKKTTDSTWTPISTAAITGYSGTLNAIRAASSANTWQVRATATDKVSSTIKTASVSTKRIPMNASNAGAAVAIGKMAETDGFEVDLITRFNKAVTLPTGANKYYIATAGSNGDYYVTVPNAANLAINDVIQISFPVATDSAQEARISIDGGSTYKNVRTAFNLLASAVQNEKIPFAYDGTYWKPLISVTDLNGNWRYIHHPDGVSIAYGNISDIAITSSGAFGTGGLYVHNGTFVIPTGLFIATPRIFASHAAAIPSFGGLFAYATSATAGGVQILRNTSSGTTTSEVILAIGLWR